jgi:hypothetical protein
VQQLKYWKSIPSVRTIMCNTSSKVLSENLFCLPCVCLLCNTWLIKQQQQQQQISGITQLCIHIGYIIISEKLQSYVILLGIAIYYSMRNIHYARYSYNLFSLFVTGMCTAMTGDKAIVFAVQIRNLQIS